MGKRPINIFLGGSMKNDSWSYVAIDGDEEVTLYKDLPELLEGKDFFARYGDRITVCYPRSFPTPGKLRLTSNKRNLLEIVLKKTTTGNFFIKFGGVRYGSYQKAPCVFTLPRPIVARDQFSNRETD